MERDDERQLETQGRCESCVCKEWIDGDQLRPLTVDKKVCHLADDTVVHHTLQAMVRVQQDILSFRGGGGHGSK